MIIYPLSTFEAKTAHWVSSVAATAAAAITLILGAISLAAAAT